MKTKYLNEKQFEVAEVILSKFKETGQSWYERQLSADLVNDYKYDFRLVLGVIKILVDELGILERATYAKIEILHITTKGNEIIATSWNDFFNRLSEDEEYSRAKKRLEVLLMENSIKKSNWAILVSILALIGSIVLPIVLKVL
ncbi:MAG: hypothetical protein PF448_06220 [Bacteroidales bacterium]|jgi:hypothetical protein|nr:hypothetical protein [Bacteroidales bacterium]